MTLEIFMKILILTLLFGPLFAQAFTASDLKMVLDDENVKAQLQDFSINEVKTAPCGRMRGDFCFDIELSNERIIEVYGNNFFNTVEIKK